MARPLSLANHGRGPRSGCGAGMWSGIHLETVGPRRRYPASAGAYRSWAGGLRERARPEKRESPPLWPGATGGVPSGRETRVRSGMKTGLQWVVVPAFRETAPPRNFPEPRGPVAGAGRWAWVAGPVPQCGGVGSRWMQECALIPVRPLAPGRGVCAAETGLESGSMPVAGEGVSGDIRY